MAYDPPPDLVPGPGSGRGGGRARGAGRGRGRGGCFLTCRLPEKCMQNHEKRMFSRVMKFVYCGGMLEPRLGKSLKIELESRTVF